MPEVVIHRYADTHYSFQDGFAAQKIMEGVYDQAHFERCALQPNHCVKPQTYSNKQHNQLFVFYAGKGYITTPRRAFNITEPTIFVPEFDRESFEIRCSADSDAPLEYLHIVTELSDYDKTCLVESRMSLPRFRPLSQGWTYVEDFKREDTTSLMLLEHRNLGRLSMGAVLGTGPAVIGQHIHNELTQWYFMLPGSHMAYTAGNQTYEMQSGDLSFTPRGYSHGSTAQAGQKYDYIWFELCDDGYPGEIK